MIMRSLSIQSILIIVLALGIYACTSHGTNTDKNFIKGVYGDPGTLLDAGYNFDELGMNAVFVRSYSLDDELYNTAREQGCRVFVEFPVLLGRTFLEDNPQCLPLDETGEPSPPADWFMGICPTCPEFKEDRRQALISILKRFEVDGVFLDYLHWHAQFETPDPILPETCSCDRCTGLFSEEYNIDIPGENIPDISEHILSFYEKEWRDWRSSILTAWITDLKQILKNHQPESLLGLFYCAWYPDEYDSALYRILGIDINDFAREADVLSPMLFHHMKDRPVSWIGEHISWLDSLANKVSPGDKPAIWPIVQAHNTPEEVSPEEFREAMLQGISSPAGGIMMFSDRSLLDDPRKIEVMRELYSNGP